MFRQHTRHARLFSSLLLSGALLLLSLAACGTNTSGNGGNTGSASTESGNISTPTTSGSTTQTPTVTTTATNFRVTSVNITVNPTSLSNYTCGSNVTVTYTATFNFPANNPGGQITFTYTNDNGRDTSAPDTLAVPSGQPDTTYQFTWSGTLPQDHTMPEPGGVMVTAPNTVNSQLVGPSGSCSSGGATVTPTTPTTPFQVTSVTVKASPSLSGQACGSQSTETYSVTFHIAAGGPGGQITFTYSTNNGRSTAGSDSVTVAPGATKATYTFTWHGTLLVDHTAPGVGVVAVTAPNAVISTGGAPSGQCTGS